MTELINKLIERWVDSGIEEGDTVLIHSSIRRTLFEFKKSGYQITPDDILVSFLETVGEKGTLLLPAFNFDFTKGVPFDINNTPSHMGSLTEVARLYPGSVRTGHPIYSFVAIGYHAKKFQDLDNQSAYSEESPFGILKQLNGKIAVLDLEDQNSMTFYHHVEEIKQVDYRYFKDFRGQYTDSKGASQQKTYTIFVRDIEKGVITNVNPAGELMWKNGLYKGYKPGVSSGLRIINARRMFEFVSELIDKSMTLNNLYLIEKI